MTAAEFRKIALSFPEAAEASHMSHPDFRVGGKIFATLGYPDGRHGVLMLSAADQERLISENSSAFSPAKGAWGRRGSTQVLLSAADAGTIREALKAAWRKAAPKRLANARANQQ